MKEIIEFVFTPMHFNYLILTLYASAALRWGLTGNWADMFYWMFAFGITATVTFGYGH